MKYKLLAVDIDDTLLNTKKELTEGVRSALMNIQEKGVRLAICSGRLPYSARKFAEALGVFEHNGYFVSFNGGMVFNSRDEVIFDKVMDRKFLEPIYDVLRPTTVATVVHKYGEMFTDKEGNRYIELSSRTNGLPLNLVGDIARFVDWDLHKMVLVDEHETLETVKKILEEKFGDELDLYYSAPYFLEIMPKGVDKGTGLSEICKDMEIEPEEAVAVGDNFNDLAMIRAAGMGVAMKNSPPEVKAQANYVTTRDCDHDGLAEVARMIEKDFENDNL